MASLIEQSQRSQSQHSATIEAAYSSKKSPVLSSKKKGNSTQQKTGAYDFASDTVPQELTTLRTTNKKRLQQQVHQAEEDIMAEFMKKAELV